LSLNDIVEFPKLSWKNIINSRPSTEDVPDEGTFSSLPNGDVKEVGRMYNPESGKVEEYEEIWRRFDNPIGTPYCLLERIENVGDEEMEVEKSGGKDKVFIGRLGSKSLAIFQVGKDVGGWREELKGNGWKRVYSFPIQGVKVDVPSLPLNVPGEWKDGAQVEWEGLNWLVRSVGVL